MLKKKHVTFTFLTLTVSECSHEHDKTKTDKPLIEQEAPDEFSEKESFQAGLDLGENPDESDLNIQIDVKSRKASSKSKKYHEDDIDKRESKGFKMNKFTHLH